MGFFKAIKEPISTKIDIDNVGLAKDSSIVGNLGKYDFVGWLLNNGTVKLIRAAADTGSSKTIYTTPTGKTTYIIYAMIFVNVKFSNTNTNQWCLLYMEDTIGSMKNFICTHTVYIDSNEIPHLVDSFHISNGIVKLPEGWSLVFRVSNNAIAGTCSIMLVEI